MNLYDWFYKQVVSPGELSAAFEAADDALRGMVTTLGIFGLAVGGDVVPAAPTPSMSVFVKGPVLAYDDQGDRIYLPDAQLAVNLAQDENNASTAIYTPQQERYLGVFIKFTRTLSDPRTDGDGNEIFFARLEGAEVVVAAGAPAPVGTASRAALRDGHVLLADVRIITGQTQVTSQHILTDRTQYLFRATSGSLNIWGRTFPEIVQKVVDRFAQFMTEMQMTFDQFSGASQETYNSFVTNVNTQVSNLSAFITSEVNRLTGLIKDAASEISFVENRNGSGITADNVQDAIEEVKATIPGQAPSLLPADNAWTGDNTFSQPVEITNETFGALKVKGRAVLEDGLFSYGKIALDSHPLELSGSANEVTYGLARIRAGFINLAHGVRTGNPRAGGFDEDLSLVRTGDRRFWQASSGASDAAVAFPIDLPSGARLVRITMGVRNDSVSPRVFRVQLYRELPHLVTPDSSLIQGASIGNGEVTVASGANGVATAFINLLPGNDVIDNATFTWSVEAQFPLGPMRLYWVHVDEWHDPGPRNN